METGQSDASAAGVRTGLADILLDAVNGFPSDNDLDLELRPADLPVVRGVRQLEQEPPDGVASVVVVQASYQAEGDLALGGLLELVSG